MFTVATPVFLVVRRHVDLGRTRSMMCWPSWTPPSDSPARRRIRPPDWPIRALGRKANPTTRSGP